MKFTLSVIVLNWNRAPLLDNCLESLLRTGGDFTECSVIDNASSDESPSVIDKWQSIDRRIVPELMPENRGAEWINHIFARASTDLVLVLANDKVLLGQWRSYADLAFRAFDDLAQLALHAPAPLDNEVWVVKPAEFIYHSGVGIYKAIGNTGLSSVLRREAVAKSRIDFHNIPSDGPIKLPDDGRFSAELRANGYFSAWSETYYCLNVGHTHEELDRDRLYYLKNYESKPSLKIQGLDQRIATYKETPKPSRKSRILGSEGVPECRSFVGHVPERCWSIYDGGSGDLETIDFVYSLCRLVKPAHTLIVRGWSGHSVLAAVLAARENDFGSVSFFEPDAFKVEETRALIEAKGESIPKRLHEPACLPETSLLVMHGHFGDISEEDIRRVRTSIGPTVRYILLSTLSLPRHCVIEDTAFRSGEWVEIDFDTPGAIKLLSRRSCATDRCADER